MTGVNTSIRKRQNRSCNMFKDCYLRFWVSCNGETSWFPAGYDTSSSKNISIRLQVL